MIEPAHRQDNIAEANETYLVISRCRDNLFREEEVLDRNDSLSGARRGVLVEVMVHEIDCRMYGGGCLT